MSGLAPTVTATALPDGSDTERDTTMRRVRRTHLASWRVPLVLVAALTALGCGSGQSLDTAGEPGSQADAESPGSDPGATNGEPTYEWGLSWPVSEIRRTDSERTFDLVLDDVPVPDGSDLCGAGAYAVELSHGPEYGALFIEVKLDNPSTYPSLEASGCERRSETVRFTATAPLGTDKPIATVRHGSVEQYFYPDGDRFTECALPGCDPTTGLPADDPGCDTLKRDVRSGTAGLDLPRRARTQTVACDESWAIVQVDFGAAACPATGDATNDCAGQNLDRAYLRLSETGFWDVFDWDDLQGCGEVPETEPTFPIELCQDLPELPRPG